MFCGGTMITVPVQLAEKSYEVIIGDGLLGAAGTHAAALFPGAKACAVISDTNVAPLYAETLCTSLRAAGITPHLITVPAGEPSKSFAALEHVTRAMITAGLDRKAFLVALGGGVTGDLAGFAAGIFFRGIPYIQIPTTILSVVDSSVGGKTGINTPEGKNLIGVFHQPARVLIDPLTLQTLPAREYNEGFAEIIKHAAIRDGAMLPAIAGASASQRRDALDQLIARNVAIKAQIVSEDEFETKGLRALLNFGHTIGHAIEASAGYGEMLHGEAIALGIRAALRLSEQFAGLSPHDSTALLTLLAAFHLPLILPESMATATIMEKLGRDKKFDQGAIRFVLLRGLGDAFVSHDVTREAIVDAIESLRTVG
jgi:3-dehydroquinate synthase